MFEFINEIFFDPKTLTPLAILLAVAVLIWVKLIIRGRYGTTPLLNRSEANLYRRMQSLLPPTMALQIQCSYGEFITHPNKHKFRLVNSKRADFVVTDGNFHPLAVIEYQGKGHFGPNWKSRTRVKRNDRIKRKAARQAGLQFIEVFPSYTDEFLQKIIANLSAGPP